MSEFLILQIGLRNKNMVEQRLARHMVGESFRLRADNYLLRYN